MKIGDNFSKATKKIVVINGNRSERNKRFINIDKKESGKDGGMGKRWMKDG